MVQTIPAAKITLYDLEQRLQLEQVQTPSFCEEWQTALPRLTEAKKQQLGRVQFEPKQTAPVYGLVTSGIDFVF